MLNIKEIARIIWNIRREEEDRSDKEIEDLRPTHSVFREAEALIAELAKQNEPVAWWNGKETAFFEHETAEACAKACEDIIGNTPHDQRMLAAIDCAVMLRSGAWKEFKK